MLLCLLLGMTHQQQQGQGQEEEHGGRQGRQAQAPCRRLTATTSALVPLVCSAPRPQAMMMVWCGMLGRLVAALLGAAVGLGQRWAQQASTKTASHRHCQRTA